jgi:hypothetical protein
VEDDEEEAILTIRSKRPEPSRAETEGREALEGEDDDEGSELEELATL